MSRYIVFDVETPNYRNDRMSAIGIAVLEDGIIQDRFFSLVNPEEPFDSFNIQLTGITPEMVQDAPTFPELWSRIQPLFDSGIPVAHNALFDLGVLKKCLADYGLFWKKKTAYLCTVQIGRALLPGISHRLNVLCDYYQIDLNHHQADSDSVACAEILLRYMAREGDLRRYTRFFTLNARDENRSGYEGYEYVDITTEAQKILSCIARTGQILPAESVADLLRGRVPDSLPQGINPAALTTFGLMKDTGAGQLQYIMEALLEQGVMVRAERDHRIVVLNPRSREVLFDHRRVLMRRKKKQETD